MWLACHLRLMEQLVLVPVCEFGGMCLWVHMWVWDALKICGSDSLQNLSLFNSKKKIALTIVAV